MKIIDAIKRMFTKTPPKKEETLIPLSCGTTCVVTGEYSQGFLNEAGEIVYKPAGKTNVWGEPQYVGTCTISYKLCVNSLFSYNEYPRQENTAIYKETNIYTDHRRYFIYQNNQKVYLEPNAYEQHGKIVIAQHL